MTMAMATQTVQYFDEETISVSNEGYVANLETYEKSLTKSSVPAEKSTRDRLERIRRSQTEYGILFSKLNSIIDQLRDKYPPMETKHVGDDVESIGDAESTTDHSSGASSSSEMHASQMSNSSSSSLLLDKKGSAKRKSMKRKLSLEECDFIDIDTADELNAAYEYPKRVQRSGDISTADEVVIGPNGTKVEYFDFKDIPWSSAAIATRCLLTLVFSSDILATHTLTGKPSPAFYGRERPPKMQLDPLKTADIIHCVRAKCDGGNEREIRSAITTKCADTAKKYKRRMLKETKT